MHNPTDSELVDRINRGGPEAAAHFETLYRRHRDWCVRLARRHAPDDSTALDAVHDAFIVLLERFPGFELRGRLTTFLYPVILNRLRDTSRTDRRRLRLLRAAPPPRPERESAAHTTHPELAAALDRLPDHHREVLLMRVVDGMSVQEVALALDIPEGTVKSRLHKALRRLSHAPELKHEDFPTDA